MTQITSEKVFQFTFFVTIPPPPGGTAILPEYIHYYGYYYTPFFILVSGLWEIFSRQVEFTDF
jgi:hypothetical protein